MISCGASQQNIQPSDVIAAFNKIIIHACACVGGFNWDHSH